MNSQNISASEQNILANSIRIARERISSKVETTKNHTASIQYNESDHNHSHNHSQSFSKAKKQTTPAAQAIKLLHHKNAELEAFNQTLTKENSILKRDRSLKEKEIQSLKQELEVRDIRVEETQKKYRLVLDKLAKVEDKLKEAEQQIFNKNESMQKNKISFTQANQQWKKTQKLLEEKVKELNKRIDNNQKIIVELIRDLEEEKKKNSEKMRNSIQNVDFSSPTTIQQPLQKNSKSKSRETITFPVIVDEPSEEESNSSRILLSSNSKIRRSSNQFVKKNDKYHNFTVDEGNRVKQRKRRDKSMKITRDEGHVIKILDQKNQQLIYLLKGNEKKLKYQQKIKNQFQSKFYTLKAVSEQLMEEINRLPQSMQYRFKRLIVRLKKASGEHIEGLRSTSGYKYNKPSRLSSKGSSAGSRSKEKPLKMEDLKISSRHSQYSHSKSKQKLMISRNLGESQSLGRKNKEKSCEIGIQKLLKRKVQQKNQSILEIHKKLADEDDNERRQILHKNLSEAMEQITDLHGQLQKYRRKNKE